MITDVNLWFARNQDNKIIVINEVKDYLGTYYCPICNSQVIPKAIKENAKMSSHFAHIDKNNCNSETMVHWWFKNKFIENGDKFIVKSQHEKQYICKDVSIEQFYETEYGIYKPDVTILTQSGETIYFEMNYSSKKKIEDCLDKWIALGNIVVEVDVKTLLTASYGQEIYRFNALFYNGKCFNPKKNDIYYNVVGRYKEDYYFKHKQALPKEQVEKLNWFWEDLRKYKLSYKTIDDIFLSMECLGGIDRSIVYNILQKTKCTDILDAYINNIKKKVLSELICFVKDKTDAETLNKLIRDGGKQYILGDIRYYVDIYDYGDNSYWAVNVLSNNDTENITHCKDYIIKSLKYKSDKEERQKRLDFQKRLYNKFINEVKLKKYIDIFSLQYENYDLKLFHHKNESTCAVGFTIDYKPSGVCAVREEIQLIQEYDIDAVIIQLNTIVTKHFNQINPISDLSIINSLYAKLQETYSLVNKDIKVEGRFYLEDIYEIEIFADTNLSINQRYYFSAEGLIKDNVNIRDKILIIPFCNISEIKTLITSEIGKIIRERNQYLNSLKQKKRKRR